MVRLRVIHALIHDLDQFLWMKESSDRFIKKIDRLNVIYMYLPRNRFVKFTIADCIILRKGISDAFQPSQFN